MTISDADFKSAATPVIVTNKSRLARLFGGSTFERTFYKDEDKHNTNITQTKHKHDTEKAKNQTQTRHKAITKLTQENKLKKQTQHKPDTQNNTKTDTNSTQTQYKPNTKITFSELVGLQRNILLFAYQDCKANRSKITSLFTLDHISKCLNIPKGSIKTTIERLLKKGFLMKKDFKNGRAGWVRYEIPDLVYHELLHLDIEHKPITNLTQMEHKHNTQSNTQHNTTISCSSGLKDLNKTTTTQQGEGGFTLPAEWEDIDFSELQRRGVNFGIPQIIANWETLKNHTALDFQMSVDEFVYDITAGHVKARKGNLALFIGIIRKGNLYASSHYISPAREKMNAVIAAAEKRKEEALLYQQALEDEAFHQWLEKQDYETFYETLKNKYYLPIYLWSSFENKQQEAYDWIKANVYLPQKNASANETENN